MITGFFNEMIAVCELLNDGKPVHTSNKDVVDALKNREFKGRGTVSKIVVREDTPLNWLVRVIKEEE